MYTMTTTTVTNEIQIFTSMQKAIFHLSPPMDDIDKEYLELSAAYTELDALYPDPLPQSPRIRKRYCVLACFSCLLCCIPSCFWNCATSSCLPEPQNFPDDPHTLQSKEWSWSCCCIGFRSRKRLYTSAVDPSPEFAIGGEIGPRSRSRGQPHARPAQNYSSTANCKPINPRPVMVVPQRVKPYVRYRSRSSTYMAATGLHEE